MKKGYLLLFQSLKKLSLCWQLSFTRSQITNKPTNIQPNKQTNFKKKFVLITNTVLFLKTRNTNIITITSLKIFTDISILPFVGDLKSRKNWRKQVFLIAWTNVRWNILLKLKPNSKTIFPRIFVLKTASYLFINIILWINI